MQDYKKLHIWTKSKDLAVEIYKVTKNFPDSEKFGLISQMRRSAAGIPANIAEGAGRNTKKDFAQFVHIAIGSLNELETYIIISKELNYITDKIYEILLEQLTELRKMLFSFIQKLKTEY